jgi:hypothetical protein
MSPPQACTKTATAASLIAFSTSIDGRGAAPTLSPVAANVVHLEDRCSDAPPCLHLDEMPS